MSVGLVDAWVEPRAAAFFRNVWPMYVHELTGFDTDFYALDANGCWQPDLAGDWLANPTPLGNLRVAEDNIPAESPSAFGVPLNGQRQPLQRAHVIAYDERPVGFACVGLRPFRYMPEDADVSIAEFFVIHAVRGSGVSLRALELLLGSYAGRWHLRALHDNGRAIRFWGKSLRLVGARDLKVRTEDGDVTFRFTT